MSKYPLETQSLEDIVNLYSKIRKLSREHRNNDLAIIADNLEHCHHKCLMDISVSVQVTSDE